MTIYPDAHIERADGSTMRLESLKYWLDDLVLVISEPGLVTRRRVTLGPAVELRTDCFCCTCHEDEYGGTRTDPYCRNHGYAGKRPCDIHDLPGAADDDGQMPHTVLTARGER